jgi:endonuclease/exonuclease/phosphatase family metal-dependent hydrolase
MQFKQATVVPRQGNGGFVFVGFISMFFLNRKLLIKSISALAVITSLTACSMQPDSVNAADSATTIVRLDGYFDDWPLDTKAQSDPYYLYLLLEFPDTIGLQTSVTATSILVDLDGDSTTGATVADATGDALMQGVELELMFAPVAHRNRDGVGGGAALRVYNAAGQATDLPHQELGFAAMPTHASDRYELRIPRYLLDDTHGGDLLRANLPVRARIVQLDTAQQSSWHSAEISLASRDMAYGNAPVTDAEIPDKSPQALRIFSVNVEWAAPLETPDAFVRIMRAVDPDIVLLQEWDKPSFVLPEGQATIQYPPQFMQDWFNTHVNTDSNQPSWYASRNEELGVIIMARSEMSAFGNNSVRYSMHDGDQSLLSNSVRYTGAVVETHIGRVAMANIHLRCCGALASREDQSRMAEAVAVNAAFRRAMADSGAILGVVAGDYNLVGSTLPIDIIALGADTDGSDLAVAPSYVLGGGSNITWRDARSGFSPSRLDYILYTDSDSQLINSFALDTEVLSDASLERMGLRREDSRFSDHFPLVLDLQMRAQ